MFKGLTTFDAYERCISSGLCDKHFIDFEKESNNEERQELQRKAFQYIRLRILDPLVFGKKYVFEKMEALISKSDYFSSKILNQERNSDSFIDNILLLDSIVVFTLCQFCKVCCCGGLFQSNQTIEEGLDQEAVFIQKLLHSKSVTENDIRHFNPLLQENFIGYDKGLIKFCYVIAILFVRNTTIKVRLKQAIKELASDVQKSSGESKKWLAVGRESELRGNYEESLEALTTALNYNPYCYRTLSHRGRVYNLMKDYKNAQLNCYISVLINPLHFCTYSSLSISLIHDGKSHEDFFKFLKYAVKLCKKENMDNQDFLRYEKILGSEKLQELSQLENFKETFIQQFETLNNTENQYFLCNQCTPLEQVTKLNENLTGSRTALENGFKNASDIQDVPDLEEAQDSEEDNEASLPDLSDASRSDESDYEDAENIVPGHNYPLPPLKENSLSQSKLSGKQFVEARNKTPKTKPESRVRSETKPPEPLINKREEKPSKRELQDLLKDSSQMLLNDCGYAALNQFVSAIEIIESTEKNLLNYEEGEIVCIKYASGLAYCSSGGYDDLLKGIEMFKEIIENHSNVTFPAAYYGMGLAYQKLNRFKDALKYLSIVNEILDKGICFKVYAWPGLKTVISETKSEQLKILVRCKIKECEMPPPPDAICRYEDCPTQPSIYYSDPDFKGFLDLQCSDHCTLQYHAMCWKLLKTSKNLTDKEFLDKSCLTPDCDGTILKVEIINKEGVIDKVFRSAQDKKAVKAKKPKAPKRVDVKEEKKKKQRRDRRESESDRTSQTDEVAQNTKEVEASEINEVPENSETANCEKEKKEPLPSPATPLSVKAQPFIVIRKEKLCDENVLKTPAKSKEIKKSKPVTISFTEFCKDTGASGDGSNHQQQGEGYFYKKEEWPSCSEVSSNSHPSSQSQESVKQEEKKNTPAVPSELDYDPLEIDDFDAIKNNLYNYLEEFLTRNGPLSVKDVRLVRELETFPTEANVVIARYGGITEFLKNDIEYRFGIVDDLFICSRSDLADAYKLSRSSGVMGGDNADLLEEYGMLSSRQGGSCSQIGAPSLNPDAKEYKPGASVASSSTNSYTSLPDDIPLDNVSKDERSSSLPLSSSPLMSALSKLRQPLAVDKEESKNFLRDHLPLKEDSSKTLAKRCVDAIKLYFSEDMDSQRAYIDSSIRPLRISTILNLNDKSLQTEEIVVKTESIGVQKTDEELENLMELVEMLTEQKKDLEVQKTLLETKMSAEMDAVAKCNKKTLIETECLKKELEDASLALQALEAEYKRKEAKLERERKVLMDSLNKSSELSDAQATEINVWCDKNQSLEEKLKTMEECMEDLLKENNSLKKSMDQQIEKYDTSVKAAEDEKRQLTQRAKSAEVMFLKFKKEAYLQRIDQKAKEAKASAKEIENCIPLVPNPFYKKNLEILLSNIIKYVNKLAETLLDIQTRCDEQINAVNNGEKLESLIPVELKELGEIPSFTPSTSNQSMNNPMALFNAAQMFSGPHLDNRFNMNSASVPPTTHGLLPTPPPPSTRQSLLPTPPPSTTQGLLPTAPSHQMVAGFDFSHFKHTPPPVPPTFGAKEKLVTPETVTVKETASKIQLPLTNSSSLSAIPPPNVAKVPNPPPALKSGAISKTPPVAPPPLPKEVAGASNQNCDSLSLELDYKGKQDSEVTASTLSLASSQGSAKAAAGKSCDKLLTKLELKYPSYDKTRLMSFIKEFRQNRKGGLSGLKIDSIIVGVSALIDSQRQPTPPPPAAPLVPEVKSNKMPVAQYRIGNKKLVEKNSKPPNPPQPLKPPPPCAWGSKNDDKNNWSGSGLEEGCIICYEEMTPSNAFRVDCGHCFHTKCIKEWLNKKSDCPICRVHVLLPEDYPALS